jgi:phosphatidylglycerophosphate synthase
LIFKENPFISKNVPLYARRGEWLAFFQLLLLILILLRILWSISGKVPLWFDTLLLLGGFLILGVGWTLYFVWVTFNPELNRLTSKANLRFPD